MGSLQNFHCSNWSILMSLIFGVATLNHEEILRGQLFTSGKYSVVKIKAKIDIKITSSKRAQLKP